MNSFIEAVKASFYNNLILESRWRIIFDGFCTTLYLTFAAFIIGTIIGIIFTCLKCSKRKWVKNLINTLIKFFIRIPILILIFIMIYVIFKKTHFSSEILAIIALVLKTASYLAEIFYAGISAVSKEEIEAAKTLGMSKIKVFKYIILPQTARFSKGLYESEFIVTLQETSVVGFVAIYDLTHSAEIVASRTFDQVAILLIISICYLLIGQITSFIISLCLKEHHLSEKKVELLSNNNKNDNDNNNLQNKKYKIIKE